MKKFLNRLKSIFNILAIGTVIGCFFGVVFLMLLIPAYYFEEQHKVEKLRSEKYEKMQFVKDSLIVEALKIKLIEQTDSTIYGKEN
jgi:hypothetical protein